MKSEDFNSPEEFAVFRQWIERQVQEHHAMQVTAPRHTPGFDDGSEQYFACLECGTLWKLMYPEIPFRGAFTKVSV